MDNLCERGGLLPALHGKSVIGNCRQPWMVYLLDSEHLRLAAASYIQPCFMFYSWNSAIDPVQRGAGKAWLTEIWP